MTRLASRILAVLVVCAVLPVHVQAQTVQSVVDAMKAQQQHLENVETYILTTNLYTSYHKRVDSDTGPQYRSVTRMTGASNSPMSGMSGVSSPSQLAHLDRLAAHATYAGTERVGDASCHVLEVRDPSALDEAYGDNLTSMTYFIDAEQHVPVRYHAEIANNTEGPAPQSMTVTLTDYRTIDGLTIPFRMEIKTDLGASLSEPERKQMETLQKQLEQMPEAQRKQMERMMGAEQLKQLQAMMSGKPTVIEVQEVSVNVPLPEGIFDGS